jgi:hypothetical protein
MKTYISLGARGGLGLFKNQLDSACCRRGNGGALILRGGLCASLISAQFRWGLAATKSGVFGCLRRNGGIRWLRS